jgi:hypothetical protein
MDDVTERTAGEVAVACINRSLSVFFMTESGKVFDYRSLITDC